jgi:hypothetical protein
LSCHKSSIDRRQRSTTLGVVAGGLGRFAKAPGQTSTRYNGSAPSFDRARRPFDHARIELPLVTGERGAAMAAIRKIHAQAKIAVGPVCCRQRRDRRFGGQQAIAAQRYAESAGQRRGQQNTSIQAPRCKAAKCRRARQWRRVANR